MRGGTERNMGLRGQGFMQRRCWEDFGFRQVGKMKNRSLGEDTGNKNKVLGANHLETGSGAVGLSWSQDGCFQRDTGCVQRAAGGVRSRGKPRTLTEPPSPGPGRWWGKRMGQALRKKSERKGGGGLRKEPGAASHHLP